MMGTIASNLTKLAETKSAIKQAIVDKGVAVADTDTFASYAEKIGEISTGLKGWDGMKFKGMSDDATMQKIVDNMDISEMTTLFEMFAFTAFTTIDLRPWAKYTSKVLGGGRCRVRALLENNTKLVSANLSGWDVSNVYGGDGFGIVFYNCNSLTWLDLTGWSGKNINNPWNMFVCSKLTTIIGDHTLEEVENGSYVMFEGLGGGLKLDQTILVDCKV